MCKMSVQSDIRDEIIKASNWCNQEDVKYAHNLESIPKI
jgi:hypothetical protein